MKKFVCGLFATLLIIYHILPFKFIKATAIEVGFDFGQMIMPLINSLFAGYEYDFSDTEYSNMNDFLEYLYENGYINNGQYGSYKFNGISQRQWNDYSDIYYDYVYNHQNATGFDSDDLIGKKIRYDMSDLRAFLDYSPYNISNFSNVYVSDIPIPNPDVTYSYYLNYMNYHNRSMNAFWFYDYPQSLGSSASGYGGTALNYPFQDYTWICAENNYFFTNPSTGNTPFMYALPIQDIYITSSNGTYYYNGSFTCLGNNVATWQYPNENSPNGQWNYIKIQNYDNQFQVNTWYNGSNYYPNHIDFNLSGSLEYIFQELIKYIKNANIYVDGVLWSYAGAFTSDVIITYPDIIDNPDLPTPVLPVYDIDHPTPAYVDVGKLIEAAQDAIARKGTLDIDSLIDNGVITDELDTPVNVIPTYYDPTIATPEELEKTDPLPIIPIPKFDLTPDNNDSTSILAQWIHGIDMVLPDDLMTVFWGIILGLILLGIIHVLNK